MCLCSFLWATLLIWNPNEPVWNPSVWLKCVRFSSLSLILNEVCVKCWGIRNHTAVVTQSHIMRMLSHICLDLWPFTALPVLLLVFFHHAIRQSLCFSHSCFLTVLNLLLNLALFLFTVNPCRDWKQWIKAGDVFATKSQTWKKAFNFNYIQTN